MSTLKYLTITAEFPLGYYQGADSSKRPEIVPSPARLFSALVSAAGESLLAEYRDGELCISDESRSVLEWLESNPPQYVALPNTIANHTGITAYKLLGLRAKGGPGTPVAKGAIERTSIGGRLVWQWDRLPSEDIVEQLANLTAEVPYLGEASSIVMLHTDVTEDVPVNRFTLAPEENMLSAITSESLPMVVPTEGRLRALERAHLLTQPTPTVAQDRTAQNESERLRHHNPLATAYRWYLPETTVSRYPNPWDETFLLEVERVGDKGQWPPHQSDYVRWCVALHQTLIYAHGPEAPPTLTGKYVRGFQRPANNLSIQIVRADEPVRHDWTGKEVAAFAVSIPQGVSDDERSAIYLALQKSLKQTVYLNRVTGLRIVNISHLESGEFWTDPAPGTKRFWLTRPLAIADTRPLKNTFDGLPWTLSDAALLSVGMVWRDYFSAAGTGQSLYRHLAKAASLETRIIQTRRVHGPDLARYLHRSHPDTTITAYNAMLDLGLLSSPSALLSVGQSRHLGGGLLIPIDLPNSALTEDGRPLWLA